MISTRFALVARRLAKPVKLPVVGRQQLQFSTSLATLDSTAKATRHAEREKMPNFPDDTPEIYGPGDMVKSPSPLVMQDEAGIVQEIWKQRTTRERWSLLSDNRQPSIPGYVPSTESIKVPQIPKPIPMAATPQKLLTLIGRDMTKYSEKFPTWESLFGASNEELARHVPNTRDRRYLKLWLQRYREGKYGPGWEIRYLDEHGNALIGVYRWRTRQPHQMRGACVVNLPPGKTAWTIGPDEVCVMGHPYGYKSNKQPTGPFARSWKANKALIDNWLGMWELKRGRKVHGGERRKKQVLFEKGVAERKERREEIAAAAF